MLTREETNRAPIFEREARKHGFCEVVAIYDDTMTEHKIRWVRMGRKTIDVRVHAYMHYAPVAVQEEIAKVLFDRIDDPLLEITYTDTTQRWIDDHKTPTEAVQ